VILDRSIREVIRKYEKLSSEKVDATVIIKTRCPFMNYKHIENAINSLQIFNLDMVTGVKLENKIFYTHNGKTMRPLRRIDLDQIRAENELIGIKIESEQIYLEAGNFIVTSDPLNMTENFQEAKIGHEILDELSSFQIKTKMDFDISKFLANKFLSNV
jgi:CMP-N-acetylneuraminic acid synthetase